MLTNLHIENMAVIERAHIHFDDGFHVLTGETGAGKSIVIDALNAVLGERTSKDVVRTGSGQATVTAMFERLSAPSLETVRSVGFDVDEEGCLMISRTISEDGRSQCRINGRPVTVSILREIGRMLVNIHGQHENQALLSVDKHLMYLDRYGELENVRANYERAYHHYCAIRRELKTTEMDESEKLQRRDMLAFQIKELEDADLTVGEEEALTKQREICRNAEKISRTLQEITFLLHGDDDTNGLLSVASTAADKMMSATHMLADLQSVEQRFQNALMEMENCAEDMRTVTDGLVFDEEALDQIETRLHIIRRIITKYGGTEQAALEYLENAQKELARIDTNDERRLKLEKDLDIAADETVAAAEMLTKARKTAGERLVAELTEQLTFLDMPYIRLSVSIEPATMTVTGGDRVEFMISANPGEPPKPMSKIASGGEMSRIMLAMKSVLADADDIDTLVFDEVDTGISGFAANKVGIKLRQTAAKRQILCVTHLAQIAAQGHRHLLVSKQVRDGRTYTDVQMLDAASRRRELARIIGGQVTDATLGAADEMLQKAQ